MVDDPDSLSFRVSPENLSSAIEILREGGGLAQYPEAYQALVLERSRPELGGRRQLPTALGARPGQRRGAFLAELRGHLVLLLAPRAFHGALHHAPGAAQVRRR
jgi:hypothetical protein